MRTRTRWTSCVPGILALVAILLVAGCDAAPSPFDPRTQAAARIAELGWVMIGLATAVCAIVFGALIVALRAAPRGNVYEPGQATASPAPEDELSSHGGGRARETAGAERAVILAGMVLPAAILVFTFGYTVSTLRDVAGVAGAGGASSFAAHADHVAPSTLGAAQPALGILPAVTVNLTGHQWWWQIEYPDAQAVTANEIHVP